ncbi:MAG: MATE family efflux transporter [Candidatus Hydrothermarchaeales archaeon]
MENTKKARLVEGPVGKMLFNMTIPMIFGMAAIIVFNLIDTFFVAQLGTNELAALSFTFPVVLVVGSLALGLGTGGAAVIAQAIGKGDYDRVKRLTTDSLILSVLLVSVFIIVGILTINPLFSLLGASPEIIVLIRQYMMIWYLGMLFVVVPMVGNSAIRATGDTKTPSIIMAIAATVNFILDPPLIFGLGPFPKLGLEGASIATVFARAITLVISLWVLYYREKMITLEIPSFKAVAESWKSILYIALPSAGSRIIIPVGMGVITRFVASYGAEAVAAFGVASRIEMVAVLVFIALGAVIAPFVGQNWAAGRLDRVYLGRKYTNSFCMAWGATMLVLLAITARPIASVFSDNPEVVKTVVLYLMIVPAGIGYHGIFLLATTSLNVLNRPPHAAALAVIQMFFLYIPLAYAGSYLFGLAGIFSAVAITYFIAGMSAHKVLGIILTAEEDKIQGMAD